MEVNKNACEKIKYDNLDDALRDFRVGRVIFTRKSDEILIRVETPEMVRRFFHDLYCYKDFFIHG